MRHPAENKSKTYLNIANANTRHDCGIDRIHETVVVGGVVGEGESVLVVFGGGRKTDPNIRSGGFGETIPPMGPFAGALLT